MRPYPLGILGLMGAGASALAPDEAEAAMLPGARKALLKVIGSKGVTRKPDGRVLLAEPKRPRQEVGFLEPKVWAQAQQYYPGANNRVFSNAHEIGKRWNRYKQKPRETLDQLQTALDDGTAKIVPNFAGDALSAPYGILAKDAYGDVFAPLSMRNNDLYIKTVLRPNATQLKALRGGGGSVPSSPVSVGLIPEALAFQTTSGAQPSPFSAVTPQENPYLQQQAKPVNHDPYLKDAIERDPLIDPIGAIFWGAGLGGGLAKGAASKILGYAGDLVGGGILDGFLSGDGAPQKGDPLDDTYGDGILWHLGLNN